MQYLDTRLLHLFDRSSVSLQHRRRRHYKCTTPQCWLLLGPRSPLECPEVREAPSVKNAFFFLATTTKRLRFHEQYIRDAHKCACTQTHARTRKHTRTHTPLITWLTGTFPPGLVPNQQVPGGDRINIHSGAPEIDSMVEWNSDWALVTEPVTPRSQCTRHALRLCRCEPLPTASIQRRQGPTCDAGSVNHVQRRCVQDGADWLHQGPTRGARCVKQASRRGVPDSERRPTQRRITHADHQADPK